MTTPNETAIPAFHEILDWERTGDTVWRSEMVREWTTGHGAFGGVLFAGGLKALRQLVDPEYLPRTLNCSCMNALKPGPFEARGEVLRQGSNVAIAELRIEQDGKPCALVVATFAKFRESGVRVAGEEAPDHPPAEDLQDNPFLEGHMPPFLQYIRQRWTKGDMPMSGSKESTFSTWVRILDPDPDDAVTLCALMDAAPFPVLQMMPQRGLLSTVNITIHLFDLEGVDFSGYTWLSSKTIHAENGYGTFAARLYRPDGHLIAWAEQFISIFDQ